VYQTVPVQRLIENANAAKRGVENTIECVVWWVNSLWKPTIGWPK
jgi:hypothetical protein